jgi:hypothetical protein
MPPTLAQLKREHPQHQQFANYWGLLDALLQGGSAMTPEIKKQLLINPDGRPAAIQEERVKVARYFNKISPIANRFLGQLFAAPLSFEGSKDKFWVDTFFPGGGLLPLADDDGQTSFQSFLRAATLRALAQGKAICQVDTAIASGARNRAEQRQAREDEPYCLLVPRGDLWDWESDRNGFKFAKLHRFNWVRDGWDSDPVAQHDFTIFQRKPDGSITTSRYTITHKDQGGKQFDQGTTDYDLNNLQEKDAQIEVVAGLEDKPIFNIRGKFQFPIVTMTLPPALWLADQLFDPQCSHFNQTASLEYGLVTSNYSMATITSEDINDFTDRNKKFGDGYYIHLDPKQGESVGWTERSGSSFNTSIEYRERVEADIDKIVQQIALAARDAVTSTSGEAIRQARRPEEILLLVYGAMVREFGEGILDAAAIAHGEDVSWKLNGLDDFSEVDLTQTNTETQGILQLQIPSPTFTKEVQKSYVREVAKQQEFEPKTLKQCLKEIDQAPDQVGMPGDMGTGGAPAQPDQADQPDQPDQTDQGDETDQLLSKLGLN